MPYPCELLPQLNYVEVMSSDEIISSYPNIWLLRKSHKNPDLGSLKFRDIFKQTSELFGLSTFLFGKYNLAHLSFKTQNPDYWNKASVRVDCETIVYSNEDESVMPLFLSCREFHKKSIPLLKEIINTPNTTIKMMTIVEHKPTVHNYWHFEIVLKYEGGETIGRNQADANWFKRSIANFFEDFLRELIKIEKQIEVDVDSQFYQE